MSDTPRTYAEIHSKDPCFSRNVVTVDANFACQLEMELNAANERIKRLEEAGDAIVDHNIGCGCGQDGPCRACRMACEAWNKAKEAKP